MSVPSASSGQLMLWFFFFNDTATTEIYTLSLHDALPILRRATRSASAALPWASARSPRAMQRSEEHTSELHSHLNLVCRLLLEKKNQHRPEYHIQLL